MILTAQQYLDKIENEIEYLNCKKDENEQQQFETQLRIQNCAFMKQIDIEECHALSERRRRNEQL